MRYESDSDTEQSLITKHFDIDTIEIHPWPDRTTYDLEIQSDEESDTSSIDLGTLIHNSVR